MSADGDKEIVANCLSKYYYFYSAIMGNCQNIIVSKIAKYEHNITNFIIGMGAKDYLVKPIRF